MALHDSLRDLVSVRGAGVVDEAEEFRGVLDDFLAEDEATLGELNLLVDAVRLGALRRVLDVMAHGAAPEAAIREAGAALARDRGTDDPARSCWALASLCFALGKVDEPMVRSFLGETGTMSARSRPIVPRGPAPDPVTSGPTTAGRPTTAALPGTGPVAPVPVTSPPTATSAGSPYTAGPVPPVIAERRSSRSGVYLLVVLIALLIGGLVATGIILLRSDDDPTASDTPTDGRSSSGPKTEPPLVSDDEMLVPYVADGVSTIYRVDVTDGTYKQVSPPGRDARAPTISPDRRTMTYQDYTDVDTDYGVPTRVDLATGESQPLFKNSPECSHTARPGWSLDGNRIAVICEGDGDSQQGIYVAGADGSDPALVYPSLMLRGSPTWISDSEFVFASYGESEGDPVQLRLLDADLGGEPVLVPSPDEGQISHADWSPDADKLLFLLGPVTDGRERGDVWTMNATGTGQRVLAEGEYSHPVWNVDGTAIGVVLVDDTGAEVLAYLDAEDPNAPDIPPNIVADPPPGEVAIPVWGTR